jgi:hypothetical protein
MNGPSRVMKAPLKHERTIKDHECTAEISNTYKRRSNYKCEKYNFVGGRTSLNAIALQTKTHIGTSFDPEWAAGS